MWHCHIGPIGLIHCAPSNTLVKVAWSEQEAVHREATREEIGCTDKGTVQHFAVIITAADFFSGAGSETLENMENNNYRCKWKVKRQCCVHMDGNVEFGDLIPGKFLLFWGEMYHLDWYFCPFLTKNSEKCINSFFWQKFWPYSLEIQHFFSALPLILLRKFVCFCYYKLSFVLLFFCPISHFQKCYNDSDKVYRGQSWDGFYCIL